ncbi:MAG: sugar ABC transporter ATP-binding protein [Sphaerochaeta sp.]|nr:sugar ABC transporter ATP-binding protein [Sphaerochaeta sp.]
METEYLLEAKGIKKNFGGVVALQDVKIKVKKGEVLALVGENGAGKSTMMNVIGGVFPSDGGSIIFEGQEVSFKNPLEAIEKGIAIIHQELSMMPDLNVIENIYMGRLKTRYGRILWKEMAELTNQQLAKLELDISPYERIENLLSSQRQMIEIAKAISTNAKLIIMDEPNSSLTEGESEKLFAIIEKLKSEGIAIIYVSHKLEEVLRISDYITVFRDGKYINTVKKTDTSIKEIISMMVGRDVLIAKYERHPIGEKLLEVSNLTGKGFRDISFSLHKGEILGFSGLVGSGRSEVCRAIFGVDPFESGEIKHNGKSIRFKSSKEAIENGFAMLAEDRKTQSIFPGLPIWFNTCSSEIPYSCSSKGIINYKRVYEIFEEFTTKFQIKYARKENPISSLSGGNQQKVILARWLAIRPQVLILDEPTHGVDVGAKEDIYTFINQLSKEGISIIFISSELQEILALCHRVVVMHESIKTGELDHTEFTEEKIMTLATGFVE